MIVKNVKDVPKVSVNSIVTKKLFKQEEDAIDPGRYY